MNLTRVKDWSFRKVFIEDWIEMTARFEYPVIQDNPTGWGPNSIPEKFKDMPYQPFSKADRLGKVMPRCHFNFFQIKTSSFLKS